MPPIRIAEALMTNSYTNENFDPAQVNQNPYELPLENLNPANPYLFAADAHKPWFKRLRDESPVHFVEQSPFGPFWSVTRYADIMTVDTSHDIYSSEPSINIGDPPNGEALPMFIAMDRPKHDEQRSVVNPVVGAENLRNFEALIRSRTQGVLDDLPIGQEIDWVDRVSIELTTRMLATLFDFPFEERRLLTRWSDVATAVPGLGVVDSEEQRHTELMECLDYFTNLWNERAKLPPKADFISMMVHGDATKNMDGAEYLGNLMLLIVGGNDTTRSTMTGSVLALHQYPDQYAKLVADPALIPSMVSETIRWQTPLAHMRRLAKQDTELGGKQIKVGEKVVMWYVSGNRDERFFENPDQYIIDRPDVRKHLSFGFGIHRCMGNRLAEMQLRILWEEILNRYGRIEVVGQPTRVASTFVKGYIALPVKLHPLSK